jgi:HD-GYP domain-containing protein (c-di-GMP phosphodiesterase class II)
MSQCKTPSYIPDPAFFIPESLHLEDRFWEMDPDLVLNKDSAQEFLRSHQLMEGLFQSEFLREMGLNPELRGSESLKGHGTRVAIFSLLINEELRKGNSELTTDTRTLASAAILHDIGKLDPEIHDVVMDPGTISKDDAIAWTLIKRHPSVGHGVTLAMPELDNKERGKVAKSIYYHHERQDGMGYHRTSVVDVPPEAQIITVADAIDVMLGKRPYKTPATTREVMTELQDCRGQFNQDIVRAAKSIRPNSGDYLKYLN